MRCQLCDDWINSSKVAPYAILDNVVMCFPCALEKMVARLKASEEPKAALESKKASKRPKKVQKKSKESLGGKKRPIKGVGQSRRPYKSVKDIQAEFDAYREKARLNDMRKRHERHERHGL